MSERVESQGAHFLGDVEPAAELERYRRLLDSVDVGLYQLDADGRFVAATSAIFEKTGYTHEELLGEHVSLLLDDGDVARLEREIRTELANETGDPATFDPATFEFAVRTATGERIPCELRFTLLTTDGRFEGTVGVVRDIGDADGQHEQLASIWRIDESFASVIDEAQVGVFVLDDEFTVAWINECTEEYFGIERETVLGRDKRRVIEETIHRRIADPGAFVDTVIATYDDNTYVEQFECRILPGDDREERWLEHRSKPIESGRYAGGRVELYYDITDRKESQEALRESEQRFRSLVQAVEEYAIFMLDPGGHVVSWNEGARRIKGYDADEILGASLSTFYTDEATAAGEPDRTLARAAESGALEAEGWRVRADGTRFWAHVTVTAIRNEDGDLEGYAKVTRDMTDRREREQQLQRERDLTDQILETSPVGIAVVHPDGSTARANERMAHLLGVPADRVGEYTAGQRDMFDAEGTLLPIEERPAGEAFESGEPVYDREILLEPERGRQRWLSLNATPIADDSGEIDRVVVTATDITELKELAHRRKRALEEREKELAAVQLATNLLEHEDRPIDELLESFVTELPRAFRHPERTAARVAVGAHEATTDAFEPTDRRITATTRTANDTPVSIEIVAVDDLGEFADRSEVAAGREDADGDRGDESAFLPEERELIETLVTLVTVHFERREYIDELQTEKNRLEQFAYAASHDLQEPLRMVSSYLTLIERRYADALDADGEEFLEFAIDGAERMRAMIDGLLEYSRVEMRGDPFDVVDLDDVISDVVTDLSVKLSESDADLTVDSLPRVEGDANQLRQVFQNLLDNAIKYSGDEQPRITVSAERVGQRWKLSVTDEGIGVDPEAADRVFDVFDRLHSHAEYAGTGIGLAICERIVERHGGEIWVTSEPGAGSTFSFTLPAVSADNHP